MKFVAFHHKVLFLFPLFLLLFVFPVLSHIQAGCWDTGEYCEVVSGYTGHVMECERECGGVSQSGTKCCPGASASDSCTAEGNINVSCSTSLPPRPSCNLEIVAIQPPNGTLFTYGRDVYLRGTMRAVSDYRIKNEDNGTFSAWQSAPSSPYQLNWQLAQNVGVKKVIMEVRNGDWDDDRTCEDTIIMSHPPSIDNVTMLLPPAGPERNDRNKYTSVGLNHWSGTETDSDNGYLNENLNHTDFNEISYSVTITDEDGRGDIQFLNIGMNRRGLIPSDIYTDPAQNCTNDPLESSFFDDGVGITIDNLNSTPVYKDLCNQSRGQRFSVDTSHILVIPKSANTVEVVVTVKFDLTNQQPDIYQGKFDVWLKAADRWGLYTNPEGIDKYAKQNGWWGVDTVYSIKDEFVQKQPYNAETLRVYWDAGDSTSGVRAVAKGCKINGDDRQRYNCKDSDLNAANGIDSLIPVRDIVGDNEIPPADACRNPGAYPGVNAANLPYSWCYEAYNTPQFNINKVEALYKNVSEDTNYTFVEYVTDDANNEVRLESGSYDVGSRWVQALYGDVFARSITFKTPASHEPPLGSTYGITNHLQAVAGKSTIMIAESSGTNLWSPSANGSTTAVVKGAPGGLYTFDEGVSGSGSVFATNKLYDALEEAKLDTIEVKCPAGDANCADELKTKLSSGVRFIDSDGIYKFQVATPTSGEASINGIDINKWATNNVNDVILLLEANTGTPVLRFISPVDPKFNLIILSKNVRVKFVYGDKQDTFENNFLQTQGTVSGSISVMGHPFCGYPDPINGVVHNCNGINGQPGWYSDDELEANVGDPYVYFKVEDGNGNGRLDDLEDKFIVDPGVYRFNMFLISNTPVDMPSMESTYPNYQSGWDNDFERMELFGGVVAPNISFDWDLIAKDNNWIPAEKFVYAPKFINSFVKLTRNIEFVQAPTDWQELGLAY